MSPLTCTGAARGARRRLTGHRQTAPRFREIEFDWLPRRFVLSGAASPPKKPWPEQRTYECAQCHQGANQTPTTRSAARVGHGDYILDQSHQSCFASGSKSGFKSRDADSPSRASISMVIVRPACTDQLAMATQSPGRVALSSCAEQRVRGIRTRQPGERDDRSGNLVRASRLDPRPSPRRR